MITIISLFLIFSAISGIGLVLNSSNKWHEKEEKNLENIIDTPLERDFGDDITLEETRSSDDIITELDTKLPEPMRGSTAVAYGGQIYLFGGRINGDDSINTILKFNPSTESIEEIALLPKDLAHSIVESDGKNIYIFGGWGDGSTPDIASDTIFKFDPVSESISKLDAVLPKELGLASSIYDGKNMYIFGGGIGEIYSDILKFSPTSESIKMLEGKMELGTYDSAAIWDGSKAYIFGGSYGNRKDTSSIQKFDPANDESIGTTIIDEKLPYRQSAHSAVFVKDQNKVFLAGGVNKIYWEVSDHILSLDTPIKNNAVELNTKLPYEQGNMAIAKVGPSIYLFGGCDIEVGTDRDCILKFNPANLEPSQTPKDITLEEICNLPNGYNKINLLHLLSKGTNLEFYRVNSKLVANVPGNPEKVQLEIFNDFGPIGLKETEIVDLVKEDEGKYSTTIINKTIRGEIKVAIDAAFHAIPFIHAIMDVIDKAPIRTVTNVIVDGVHYDIPDEVIESADERLKLLPHSTKVQEVGVRSPVDIIVNNADNLIYSGKNSHPEIAIFSGGDSSIVGTDKGTYDVVYNLIENGKLKYSKSRQNLDTNLGLEHSVEELFPDTPSPENLVEKESKVSNYNWLVYSGIGVAIFASIVAGLYWNFRSRKNDKETNKLKKPKKILRERKLKLKKKKKNRIRKES